MDRWGYQNAFSILTRKGKYGAAHMISGALIQQAVISPSGCYVYLCPADHVVELIGMDSCRVDHIAGLIHALICFQSPSALYPADIRHLSVKFKVHAVGIGIFRQRNIQIKGTYDACRRRIENARHLICQIGLHFLYSRLIRDDFQILYTVLNPPLIQSSQVRQRLLIQTYHKGSAGIKGKIQLPCQFRHNLVSFHIQPGHKRAFRRVVSGMDNGTVGLGSAAAHILLPLQDTGIHLIP